MSTVTRSSDVEALAQLLRTNVESVIRGKAEVVHLCVVCLLAEGHLLIEDVPGTGKTTLVRALAGSVGASWGRVQFTPDLLPTDIAGATVWNAGTNVFEFRAGPVFAHFVIADEINRASPKTQSALLEVMEERHVTADGHAHAVPRPFLVAATQNPVEMDGTYRLPEAQLDRFLMRVSVGYPDVADEAALLTERTRNDPLEGLRPVVEVDQLQGAIEAVRDVAVTPALTQYVARVAARTRRSAELRLGVSPRGSLALVRASRALAAMQGRTYVVAEDVRALAVPVLTHRLLLTAQAELTDVTAADVLTRAFDAEATPTAGETLSGALD